MCFEDFGAGSARSGVVILGLWVCVTGSGSCGNVSALGSRLRFETRRVSSCWAGESVQLSNCRLPQYDVFGSPNSKDPFHEAYSVLRGFDWLVPKRPATRALGFHIGQQPGREALSPKAFLQRGFVCSAELMMVEASQLEASPCPWLPRAAPGFPGLPWAALAVC